MKFSALYFICCDGCGKKFGGPEGGDYDMTQWTEEQLQAMLLAEARDFFWILISCGADEKLFCSKRCAKRWVGSSDCFGNAS